MECMQAIKKQIRVSKQDSAFVYAILESHEGICSYSTLDFQLQDAHRDLELTIPVWFLTECEWVLGELGDIIYEIRT